jgi:hypothetical protein
MKKLMVAAAALAFGAVASAGEYHVGKYLLCYDCHSMHGSQSHGFGNSAALGSPGPASAQLGGDWQFAQNTVFTHLLKGAESESCMSCHDGKNFAPDVVGDNFNGYPRSGGSIADGSPGHDTFKGHTLDVPGAVPPGGTAMANGLRCFDCHIQHGMANSYRNLGSRADVNTQPTFVIQDQSVTATDLTKDVTIRVATAAIDPTAVGTVHYLPQIDGVFGGYYDMRNISYSQQTVAGISYANRMNNLCALCHPNFHGAPAAGATGDGASGAGVGGALVTGTGAAGYEAFTRHPTSGVYLGWATSGGHTKSTNLDGKVTKVKAAQKNAGDFISASPMCISCHNAHGSTNGFGLRFIAGNATLTAAADIENGTGRYSNLCNQCHSQGTSNVETYTGPLSGVVK